AVLRKAGKLTDEERDQIRPHPEQGWAILQGVNQLSYLIPGVLHHHERYDGKGYPDGLAGDTIPLPARILAVADSYDAMVSDRPYRKGMPEGDVEQILRQGAGTQWDPKVVEAFFRAVPDIRAIWEKYVPHAPMRRDAQGGAAEGVPGRCPP
ncbi:MAG: HD domain-containing protein, partial [Thermoguttaceae bacterium]|nr:HD domain-containing protein [Thermoguttaceae bacterium]